LKPRSKFDTLDWAAEVTFLCRTPSGISVRTDRVLPISKSLSLLIGAFSPPGFLVYAGVALLLAIFAGGCWLAFGRGPRRRRSYRRILKLIDDKAWSEALDELRRLQTLGLLSRVWQSRIRQAEGECHRLAGEAALAEKRFSEALESLLKSARLLDKDEAQCRARVVDEMLEEIRRLFVAVSPNPFRDKSAKQAHSNGQDNGALPDLIRQLLSLQSPCPEASFWLGLWQVQQNRIDLALAALEDSCAAVGETVFDPPFYLGVLHLREGRISEALRHLSDTNRRAPECPLVPWQLGMAMVSEGGKDSLAVRPLQKALGPNGLAAWARSPYKLWQEALPDREHSYVRRLAEKYPFVCPVLGADVGAMIRQGQIALAQAHYRLRNFSEAVDLYEAVLKESPPTLPILRGLGISLARLQRYDEAFKHLRAAFELEQNQDRRGGSALTVGYLALCGAKGRPSQPEDKQKNVLWAIRSLSGFDLPGDIEWARVNSAVFAEARSLNLPLPLEDQLRLCNLLASVDATDAETAAAYHQLAITSPESLRPEHAWLYCRAVQQYGLENPKDLEICHRAFADESGMRAFFEKRSWDLEEVEYLFLARCTANADTTATALRLPESLRAKMETFLLARCRRQEQAGQAEEALASAEVLVRLAPRCAAAYDLLARLHYQAGRLRRASDVLAQWHEHFPDDYWSLVRKAIIDQKRGQADDSLLAIRKSLERTGGPTRAEIAVLGGRLALLSNRASEALALLEQALQEDPHHPAAWWCAAAVRCRLGRRAELATQLPSPPLSDTPDPRFHYMAAVAYLTAGQYAQSIDAARKAAAAFSAAPSSTEAAECNFLRGLVQFRQQDIPAASVAFQEVINCPEKSPSADYARAQLARIRFSRGSNEEAIELWKGLSESKRTEWGLDVALQRAVFLAAVQALKLQRYEQAAGFLRESCLDKKDSGHSALLSYTLVKAGQEALGRCEYETARRFLQEAILNGCEDSTVGYRLGRAYKQLGRIPRAREALQKIARPDADTFFQLGLLSLEEKRLIQAEEEFARAWAENPEHYPAGYNLLFTRLSLGQVDRALELLPKVLERSSGNDRNFLELLNRVLQSCQASGDDNVPPLMMMESSHEEEQRLLQITRELGHPATTAKILHTLASQRPDRIELHTAFLEATLVQAKQMLDRCDWHEAHRLLAPSVGKEGSAPQSIRIALLNLYGCCICLSQDFETAMHSFTAALQIQNRDARLSQNLALAYELQGRLGDAESHWNWYLEMLDGRIPTPPAPPGYRDRLAFECLHRLALRFSEKGKWTNALTFFQRAHQLRPEDADTLERLFHLLNQLKKPEEARKMLRRLQQLRPQEPQIEMFELELIELNNLENCNRALAGIEALKQKYPDDSRLPEREGQLVGAVVTYLKRLSRQISEQVDRAAARVRRMPGQTDWPEMRHYLRDLRGRMQRLKKTAARCLALAASEQHRRDLQQLISHADQEIDHCRTLV
jgi:tetratricopeptide (TPR) repeat protein